MQSTFYKMSALLCLLIMGFTNPTSCNAGINTLHHATVISPGAVSDYSIQLNPGKEICFDISASLSRRQYRFQPRYCNLESMQPSFTCAFGLTHQTKYGLAASIVYRMIDDCPVSTQAPAFSSPYMLDLSLNYTSGIFSFALTAENFLNINWTPIDRGSENLYRIVGTRVNEFEYSHDSTFLLQGSLTVSL